MLEVKVVLAFKSDSYVFSYQICFLYVSSEVHVSVPSSGSFVRDLVSMNERNSLACDNGDCLQKAPFQRFSVVIMQSLLAEFSVIKCVPYTLCTGAVMVGMTLPMTSCSTAVLLSP